MNPYPAAVVPAQEGGQETIPKRKFNRGLCQGACVRATAMSAILADGQAYRNQNNWEHSFPVRWYFRLIL